MIVLNQTQLSILFSIEAQRALFVNTTLAFVDVAGRIADRLERAETKVTNNAAIIFRFCNAMKVICRPQCREGYFSVYTKGHQLYHL